MSRQKLSLFNARVLSTLALSIMTNVVIANNFDDFDLNTRITAALNRFSTYGDVAALGNASVGSPYSSSFNPGSSAWYAKDIDVNNVISPQYVPISFDNGADLNTTIFATVFETESVGSIQPVYVKLNSDTFMFVDGSTLDFDADVYQIAWSNKISNTYSMGFTLAHTQSESNATFLGIPTGDTQSSNYSLTFGGLHGLSERLFLGYTATYSDDSSTTRVFDPFNTGIGTIETQSKQDALDLRLGFSYWFENDWQVFSDVQHAIFESPFGDLNVNRIFAGVSIPFSDRIYGRLGFIHDDDSNTTSTIGLGVYPNDNVGFEIAYQDNTLPELNADFGESSLLNLSFYIYF